MSDVDFWTKKPVAGAGGWSAYWATLHAPHRDLLIETLRTLPHFSSLLEVGCGPGVNLWRIQEAFPDADLTGLDVSEAAIDHGAERFADADRGGLLRGGGRVALCAGILPEALEAMGPVDVVLSCYACAYVPPTLIKDTLDRMRDLANLALVIAEPMVTPYAAGGVLRRDLGEYRYDYLRWINAQAGWKVTAMRPVKVDRMNRVLVAQRA